jgi:hypothetical protein
MAYKTEFQSNNADLQSILNTINAMSGGSEIESSSFVPTNSGGNTYKSKFSDNNIDLQRLLEMALALPLDTFYDSLIDFEYIKNDDGTATLTAWKGTLNGEPSTELVIPDSNRIIL